jgi:hypothetical protein
MNHQHAERAGTERAEDSQHAVASIHAIRLYGPNSWRELNAHLYPSDASLRWAVDQRRAELIAAKAVAVFNRRLFALLPTFTDAMLRYAQDAVAERDASRLQAAQAAADAAISGFNT